MKRQFLILAAALGTIAAATGACSVTPEGGDPVSASASSRTALTAAIASPSRTPANVARDRYRHPAETLAFFGVDPTDTVVEIWPGGGWYTEIHAPYLANGGTYFGASPGGKAPALTKMMEADAARYGGIRLAAFPAWNASDPRVPDGSADVVLTFRNVHNWVQGYQRPDERILEDVSDRLTDDPHVDASEIEVRVENREVTLNGTVASRFEKRHAEDVAESVPGVAHVQNNLRVQQAGGGLDTVSATGAGGGQTGTLGPAGGPGGTGSIGGRRKQGAS